MGVHHLVKIEHTGLVLMSHTFHTKYLGPIQSYNVAITIVSNGYLVGMVRGV